MKMSSSRTGYGALGTVLSVTESRVCCLEHRSSSGLSTSCLSHGRGRVNGLVEFADMVTDGSYFG